MDLLHGLASELGIIYSLFLIFIGFGLGILVWRWVTPELPGSDIDSLAREIADLENELKLVVTAISDLWTKTRSPTIQRRQDEGRIKSFRGSEHSALGDA